MTEPIQYPLITPPVDMREENARAADPDICEAPGCGVIATRVYLISHGPGLWQGVHVGNRLQSVSCCDAHEPPQPQ